MNRLRLTSLVTLFALALPALALPAQEPPPARTFAQLRQQLAQRLTDARKQERRREAEKAALVAQARELEAFLLHEAKGDDAHDARMMLIETYYILGDRDKAVSALSTVDADKTPALRLLNFAQLAEALGMQDQRKAWADAAAKKEAPFEERMAIGMHLLTMREIAKGNRVFTDALAAAKDDEERAHVRWYQVAALREREDRDDDAYYKALDALAKELPNTTYGGIARDRVLAAEHAVGKPPVPLALTTMDSRTITLESLHGKVVILDFWASTSAHAASTASFLRQLRDKFTDQYGDGLQIVSISLDDDRAACQAFAREHKMDWALVCEGRGWLSHAALRYNIEAVPHLIVLDRKGLLAGLNLVPATDEDRRAIEDLVRTALAR
jgi:peroxiredoxin